MKKLFLLLMLVPLVGLAQPGYIVDDTEDPSVQTMKFMQFLRYLSNSYVDSIDYPNIIEAAIKNVIAELDPHSAYISAEEMEQVQQSFEGNFSGIGIEFNIVDDTIFVVNTIVGGPAEKVGMQPNDKIVAVDGESVVGVKQMDVPKLLRGPKGTEVNLDVVRMDEKEKLEFRIIRDDIPITTVDASYMVDKKTGYIRVNRFANNTMSEFREAYRKMNRPEALIIDLRGNGGGLMNEGLDMANFFLPQGSLIVSTEGEMVPDMSFIAEEDGDFKKGKVVLLIDEFSASASEIVAGALQDWDRAVIVGRRSFGKGLVQRQYLLVDGSAVRITVARYHTPTGRVIQRPYEIGNSTKYNTDLVERILSGNDSLVMDESMAYRTLRLGKTVYGGGGIYPDYYVAADTAAYSDYWAKLIRKGVINEYMSVHLDQNRQSLQSRYPTFEKYLKEYEISDDFIEQLAALGERREVERDPDGMAESLGTIKIQLKALLAQKLWTPTEYYRIYNRELDDIFQQALRVIDNWDEMAGEIATESI